MTAICEWVNAWEHIKQGKLYRDDYAYFREVQYELLRSKRRDKQLGTPHLGETRDGRFHFRLGSVPYVGNLHQARIFLLMLNPGVCAGDYEDRQDEKVQKLFEQNRRQKLDYCFALQQKNGPRGWAPYY